MFTPSARSLSRKRKLDQAAADSAKAWLVREAASEQCDEAEVLYKAAKREYYEELALEKDAYTKGTGKGTDKGDDKCKDNKGEGNDKGDDKGDDKGKGKGEGQHKTETVSLRPFQGCFSDRVPEIQMLKSAEEIEFESQFEQD